MRRHRNPDWSVASCRALSSVALWCAGLRGSCAGASGHGTRRYTCGEGPGGARESPLLLARSREAAPSKLVGKLVNSALDRLDAQRNGQARASLLAGGGAARVAAPRGPAGARAHAGVGKVGERIPAKGQLPSVSKDLGARGWRATLFFQKFAFTPPGGRFGSFVVSQEAEEFWMD